MIFKQFILTCFLNIYLTNAAVFLWSNNNLEVSPLMPFDDEDFEKLIIKLHNPKVFRFKVNLKNDNAVLPSNLKKVVTGYSAYNANGNIATANAIDVAVSEDCNGLDILKIQETLAGIDNSSNFISVIDIAYGRYKRQVSNKETFETPEPPKGSVVYKGKSKKDNLFAILYSSRALLLKMNDTVLYLGNTDPGYITVDTRLNVPSIPLEGGNKGILRFSFSWLNGYWYLPSIMVTISSNIVQHFDYNLTTDENIMAPAHFSYHCNGETVFYDPVNAVELYIYDLQVQIDSKTGIFGDANDCVTFTTAPIWSGLFVTTILGLGLIVALTAIMDIKTMDKFDNCKTKSLSITVSE